MNASIPESTAAVLAKFIVAAALIAATDETAVASPNMAGILPCLAATEIAASLPTIPAAVLANFSILPGLLLVCVLRVALQFMLAQMSKNIY